MSALSALGCGGGGGGRADVPKAEVKIPLEVYDFTLPNGMRIILDEDKSAPVVAVDVWYKVGSKDDPKGRGGFAHLFEHLMFQGTHSIEGDVHEALHLAGATHVNASTNMDRTEYHETVPKGALEWAIWFESERMGTMGERLDQKTLDRERKVVKNEYRERFENIEGGFSSAIRNRALFGLGHPYGHDPIGTLEELDAASLEEVRSFHEKYYRPSSAVVSLVGDFDHKQATAWILKYFGAVPKSEAAPIVRTASQPILDGERHVEVEANVPFPSLWVTYPAPADSPEHTGELTALAAVTSMMAGATSYYLVEERKYARDVAWGMDPGLLGSSVSIHVTLAKNGDPHEALRVLDIAIFDKQPRDFGSINPSINRTKLHDLVEYEGFDDRAELYARNDDFMQNPLYMARELENLDAVGRRAAFDAREKYLKNKNRVVVTVTPNPSAPIGGRVVTKTGEK